MSQSRKILAWLPCLLLSCSGATATTTPTAAPPAASAAPPGAACGPAPSSSPAQAGDVAGGDAAATTHSKGAEAAPTQVPEAEVLRFERELEIPVRSLALGKRRMAALADEPWWKDKGKWRAIPLPARYRPPAGAESKVEIYFGRDDRPRLMGYWWQGAGGAESSGPTYSPVYLRFKAAGWHAEWGEIGRLGPMRPGALYGVLGHGDPEVVCKQAEVCIIKRRSGWTTIPAQPGTAQVKLCRDQAWAVFPQAIARVANNELQWVSQNTPWQGASGFWGHADGTAWVSVERDHRLFRFDGKGWQESAAPIAGPRDFWAWGPNDLWVVGEGGAAHYDGSGWTRARGVAGPLRVAQGSSANEVWLGGRSGLWHGTAPADESPPTG